MAASSKPECSKTRPTHERSRIRIGAVLSKTFLQRILVAKNNVLLSTAFGGKSKSKIP
jgi:hypothetical protein